MLPLQAHRYIPHQQWVLHRDSHAQEALPQQRHLDAGYNPV